MIATDRRGFLMAYGAFALLALIWGFSYILIKVGVSAMPATVVVLIRVGSGALALLAVFGVLRRNPLVSGWRQRMPAFALQALTSSIIPFIAITWGQYYISTGLASILNATTPLWTAVLAYWVTPAERPSRLNYMGVAAGFIGTGILIGPGLVRDPLQARGLATLAVLLGAASYAAAALSQRRYLKGVDPLEASLWQLTLSTAAMVVIAAPAIPSAHPGPLPVAAVLVLGVAGSALAYILYYYILNSLGGTRGASVTFVIPVTAVFWGALLFHERLAAQALFGMAVILFGIFLTSLQPGRQPSGPLATQREEATR
ncbi:MAG: DMT family transporter [Candidatus Dormibacteraeota bacterium]|nr:DMT family transporter [Candidatus Dormibacteraeota bacterium]